MQLLLEAKTSPLGIVVETSNAERLRQKLYAARKNVPGLESLSFIISPANGRDLWIVNRGGQNGEG